MVPGTDHHTICKVGSGAELARFRTYILTAITELQNALSLPANLQGAANQQGAAVPPQQAPQPGPANPPGQPGTQQPAGPVPVRQGILPPTLAPVVVAVNMCLLGQATDAPGFPVFFTNKEWKGFGGLAKFVPVLELGDAATVPCVQAAAPVKPAAILSQPNNHMVLDGEPTPGEDQESTPVQDQGQTDNEIQATSSYQPDSRSGEVRQAWANKAVLSIGTCHLSL